MTKTANWNETKWEEQTCQCKTKKNQQQQVRSLLILIRKCYRYIEKKKNMVWECRDSILRTICDVTRWRKNGQKAEKYSDQNGIQFKEDD